MMVSVETYLLRGKRRWLQLSERPGFRLGSNMLLYGGGGFLLSSASLWQHMQPFAAGLAAQFGLQEQPKSKLARAMALAGL